jgi:hypothetical protein
VARIDYLCLAIKSRLVRARPARLLVASTVSVSNDCKREVNAAPRFQDLLGVDEPEGRVLGEALGVVESS